MTTDYFVIREIIWKTMTEDQIRQWDAGPGEIGMTADGRIEYRVWSDGKWWRELGKSIQRAGSFQAAKAACIADWNERASRFVARIPANQE